SGDDLVFLAVISATGEAGVSTGKGGAPPPPVLGKTFNAGVVSGKVSCRDRGTRAFVPVTKPIQLETGSECDATHGVIRVTSAAGRAVQRADGVFATPTQFSDFYSGRFVVTQKPAAQPVTDVTLSG